jgi:hypothetical protein
MDLQLAVQAVPITTKVVSAVLDTTLCNKTDCHDITEAFLEVAFNTILVEDQLSPTCTLLAHKFSDHFLQKTIINGDKADSKILHLYFG